MIPLLSALTPIIEKALSFIPDPAKKAEAQLKLQAEVNRHSEEILKALSAVDLAQTNVNAEEAKSTNIFIAGWRPFIGWVCGAAFVWAYILQPVVVFILQVTGNDVNQIPKVNIAEMMPVLLGMLGFGGIRAWEKGQRVQDKH